MRKPPCGEQGTCSSGLLWHLVSLKHFYAICHHSAIRLPDCHRSAIRLPLFARSSKGTMVSVLTVCTSPPPFWIWVKGAHVSVDSGKRGREARREGWRGWEDTDKQERVAPGSIFPLLTREACNRLVPLSLVVLSSSLPTLALLHSFFLYYLFVEKPFTSYSPGVEILFGFWIPSWPPLPTWRPFAGSCWQLVVCPQELTRVSHQ